MAAPRVILLICAWLCVQWLVGFVPVRTFRNAYVSCQHDPSCRGHDVAREWDTRRTYAAILWSQFAQPVGSALLLSLTRTSRSRRRHLLKAVAFGLLGGALGGITGLLVYDYFPRPGYWSAGNVLLEGYFVFPLFPILSAVAGGLSCGILDWKMWVSQESTSGDPPRAGGYPTSKAGGAGTNRMRGTAARGTPLL